MNQIQSEYHVRLTDQMLARHHWATHKRHMSTPYWCLISIAIVELYVEPPTLHPIGSFCVSVCMMVQHCTLTLLIRQTERERIHKKTDTYSLRVQSSFSRQKDHQDGATFSEPQWIYMPTWTGVIIGHASTHSRPTGQRNHNHYIYSMGSGKMKSVLWYDTMFMINQHEYATLFTIYRQHLIESLCHWCSCDYLFPSIKQYNRMIIWRVWLAWIGCKVNHYDIIKDK